MARYELGIGQGDAKETYAGNSRMNRYGAFNGLERPRCIDEKRFLDENDNLPLLGYDPPSSKPVAANIVDYGEMQDDRWATYKYIGLCSWRQRPVAVDDETLAFTRSNPSPVSDPVYLNPGDRATSVAMDYIPRKDITHLGLYRNRVALAATNSSYQALQGSWYLTLVTSNASHGGPIRVYDTNPDTLLGQEVEIDNFPPNAHPFAVEIDGRVFAGGSRAVGSGLLCTATVGSWGIKLDTAGKKFHDGIRGWVFTIIGDSTGGVDGLGNYFAWYLDDDTLQLRDADNNPVAYDGSEAGSGKRFVCYLDGRLLRYSKWHEPEAWPLANANMMRDEISGLARIPNQSMMAVITKEPEIRIYDITSIGTSQFDTSVLISNEFYADHYSLVAVEGRLRGLDPWRGCIWESDGSAVRDLTRGVLKDIWEYLSTQTAKQRNWHGAYDPYQKIFAEFVTLSTSFRMVDFSIIQNIRTGRWFFGWPKDLLCNCLYWDPNTGRSMVLGGTQGLGDTGGTWGRIWTPGHYNDWIYPDSLLSGTITSATPTVLTVDVSGGTNLQTAGDGLKGRWVLATDANDINEQLGLITVNSGNTITINVVYGGNLNDQFSPVPVAGWKFYLGLIECRWGPRRFTFEDPSVMKHVIEVYARIKDADSDNPPFIRLYKGVESDHDRQIALTRGQYLDKSTYLEAWQNKQANVESALQWGMALYDRSYEGITVEDITLVFNPVT